MEPLRLVSDMWALKSDPTSYWSTDLKLGFCNWCDILCGLWDLTRCQAIDSHSMHVPRGGHGPANTRRWPNAGSMLWPSIGSISRVCWGSRTCSQPWLIPNKAGLRGSYIHGHHSPCCWEDDAALADPEAAPSFSWLWSHRVILFPLALCLLITTLVVFNRFISWRNQLLGIKWVFKRQNYKHLVSN